jgi:putative transposase
VVCRLQRRIHAGRSALLLSADHQRLRHALPAELRGAATTKEDHAFAVFERAFREFGLPQAIRTDNGVPFASAHALFGLSKLAVWWLRLGIRLERIKPGHLQQNGRHERMHLTLKKEATKPAAQNFLQQRAKFDALRACFNDERPHEALTPAECPFRGRP